MIKGNDLPGTELSNDAIDQALEWLARLRADTVGESELSDFTNWLTAADNHQQAWDYALDVWESLGVLSHMPLDDLLIDNPGSGRPQGLTYLLKMKWITSAWKSLAAVSATVAIVLTLLFASQPATQNYSAGLGEYRQVSLEDGSTIELNTNSQITVRLSQSSREVELVSGEAFFTVAPDKHSPFIVRIGDSKVQALGTAFNIYRQTQDQAAITVVEGVVRVSEGQGSALAAAETQLLLVDQSASSNLFQSQVIRDARGEIIQILANNQNFGSREIQGVDLDLAWRLFIAKWGTFGVNLGGAYIDSYEFSRGSNAAATDLAGTFVDRDSGGNGSIPEWKSQLNLFWQFGRWELALSSLHVSSLTEYFIAEDRTRDSGAWSREDMQLSYYFNSGESLVTLGIENVFAQMPPFLGTAFNDNFDVRTHDSTGRFIYARLSHRL